MVKLNVQGIKPGNSVTNLFNKLEGDRVLVMSDWIDVVKSSYFEKAITAALEQLIFPSNPCDGEMNPNFTILLESRLSKIMGTNKLLDLRISYGDIKYPATHDRSIIYEQTGSIEFNEKIIVNNGTLILHPDDGGSIKADLVGVVYYYRLREMLADMISDAAPESRKEEIGYKVSNADKIEFVVVVEDGDDPQAYTQVVIFDKYNPAGEYYRIKNGGGKR